MNERYEAVRATLRRSPRRWLVTGAAGFIGSHLVEELILLGQHVVAFDDFSTGTRANLATHTDTITNQTRKKRLRIIPGDMRDSRKLRSALNRVDIVLHHAAVVSVPLSMTNPSRVFSVNVDGFVNLLEICKELGILKVVYASSSAVYGRNSKRKLNELTPLDPLSPYALSKQMNEQTAALFAQAYGMHSIGLRYFNVYGPRQNLSSEYSAVIPKWSAQLANNRPIVIHGQGVPTRDFCFVNDVVQANLLAAVAPPQAWNRVYNIGTSCHTSLTQLYKSLVKHSAETRRTRKIQMTPLPHDQILHSSADIHQAQKMLGFKPQFSLEQGLQKSLKLRKKI